MLVDRFPIVDAGASQQRIPSTGRASVPGDMAMMLTTLFVVIVVSLMVMTFGTLTLARAAPLPPLFEIPQRYLPGNLPPEGMMCDAPGDLVPHCFIEYQGYTVNFDFDVDTRTIIRTVISVEDYLLGDLIVAWGTPTGLNWNNYTAYVYWPTRWAIIDNRSLRPDSPILSIMYTPAQPPASPWRGFWRHGD